MGRFTIQNLKEIDNAAESFGLETGFEARFATRSLECEQSGLSYQRLPPRARSAFGHRHHEEEEVYVVVGGHGRVRLAGAVGCGGARACGARRADRHRLVVLPGMLDPALR
jgi:uncharacterized cupin superfamily protein